MKSMRPIVNTRFSSDVLILRHSAPIQSSNLLCGLWHQKRISNGFALIEVLVASIIIGAASLGLGVSLNKMGQTNTKAKAAFAALAIESSLQTAIQNTDSFVGIATELANGTTQFPNLILSLMVSSGATETLVSIPLGQDVYFDNQGKTCVSCAQNQSWAFLLRVQGQRIGSSPYPIYALAYKVSFNSRLMILPNLGSQNATGFSTGDYKWLVSPESYPLFQTAQNCNSELNEVLITGINKDTGQISCLPLAASNGSACSPNQIAVGWELSNGTLKLSCQDLGTGLCPTANYALQNFNLRSLATKPTGSCVFITTSGAPLRPSTGGVSPPYTGHKIQSAQVCPPHYRFVGDCVIVSSQQWPGFDEGCVAPSTGSRPIAIYPSSFNQLIKSLPTTGSAVSCELLNPVETHALGNAVWDAQLQLVGNCVLEQPSETIDLVGQMSSPSGP